MYAEFRDAANVYLLAVTASVSTHLFNFSNTCYVPTSDTFVFRVGPLVVGKLVPLLVKSGLGSGDALHF